jgi:hypothetical protein
VRVLGIDLKQENRYAATLKDFQSGAKAGKESAAFSLENGFDGPAMNAA